MNTGVYQITNKKNGKRYIGSAIDLRTRKHTHFSDLKYQRHKNRHLQRSYNKHGRRAFRFNVLVYCEHEQCVSVEQWFLDNYKPEYNIATIANSNLGIRWSRTSRAEYSKWANSSAEKQRRRKAALGNTHGLGNRSRTGQKLSPDERRKISLAIRGEGNGRAVLTEQAVMLLRYLISRGMTRTALAKQIGIAYATASFAVSGETWKHIDYLLGAD